MPQPSRPSPNPFKPGQFELEKFLPYRLSLLTNTISQGIANSYRQYHDISTPEWRILAVLGRFPGLTSTEVAERTAMDKVAISRAVKRLEERQYLKRRTDEVDRRRQSLTLTNEAGQTVLSEVIPEAKQYEEDLLSVLSREQMSQLADIVSTLQRTASDLNAQQAKK